MKILMGLGALVLLAGGALGGVTLAQQSSSDSDRAAVTTSSVPPTTETTTTERQTTTTTQRRRTSLPQGNIGQGFGSDTPEPAPPPTEPPAPPPSDTVRQQPPAPEFEWGPAPLDENGIPMCTSHPCTNEEYAIWEAAFDADWQAHNEATAGEWYLRDLEDFVGCVEVSTYRSEVETCFDIYLSAWETGESEYPLPEWARPSLREAKALARSFPVYEY